MGTEERREINRAFEIWVWCRMFRISYRERITNTWIPEIDVPKEKKCRRKLSKYCHWKRSNSEILASFEDEIEWIEDV